MISEQDRINAMISYFFLGPLFLLSKKGTPLANPFVRNHAKTSSKIIGIAAIFFLFYIFLSPYLELSIFRISLGEVYVMTLMIVCSLSLLRGALRAYHGESSNSESTNTSTPIEVDSSLPEIQQIRSVEIISSEEDRMRILASHLPYVGIFLTSRYDIKEMSEGRKIASFFVFLLIISILFFGEVSFFTFLFSAVYILFFVFTGVYLIVYNRYVSWKIFSYLPPYEEIEKHIRASGYWIFDFFRVIFGKEKKGSYQSFFAKLNESQVKVIPRVQYFMPKELITIPCINIVTIPSLFIKKYSEYRIAIIQGLITTLCTIVLLFSLIPNSSVLFFLLLFSIFYHVSSISRDIETSTPVIGFIVNLFLGNVLKKKSEDTAEKPDNSVEYTYTSSEKLSGEKV